MYLLYMEIKILITIFVVSVFTKGPVDYRHSSDYSHMSSQLLHRHQRVYTFVTGRQDCASVLTPIIFKCYTLVRVSLRVLLNFIVFFNFVRGCPAEE